MFDDHVTQPMAGSPPPNLPIGDPADMFSAVDESMQSAPTPNNTESQPYEANVPQMPPSAVGAGVLQPKSVAPIAVPSLEPQSPPPVMQQPPMGELPNATPSMVQQSYPTKGPGVAKILIMVVLVVVVIGALAVGAWFVYKNVTNKSVMPQDTSQSDTNDVVTPSLSENIFGDDVVVPTQEVDEATQDQPVIEKTPDQQVDDALIFGQLIDTDGDGLDDIREVDLRTDPKNWDTDGDDLSDGDEVIIWKTQPLNPDTDGDTFKDGEEIKGGYNPVGPGRLFEPPTN